MRQFYYPAPRLGQAVSPSQHNLLILTKLSSREPWGGVLGTLAPTQLSTLKPDKTRDLQISGFYMSDIFEYCFAKGSYQIYKEEPIHFLDVSSFNVFRIFY